MVAQFVQFSSACCRNDAEHAALAFFSGHVDMLLLLPPVLHKK